MKKKPVKLLNAIRWAPKFVRERIAADGPETLEEFITLAENMRRQIPNASITRNFKERQALDTYLVTLRRMEACRDEAGD